MNNIRYNYLDIAKGIGIFLVVFGHVTHIIPIREYIWSFHMPLFFFISGLLYNSNDTFVIHLKKRMKSIIIPYILFFIISYMYWIFIERKVRGGEYTLLHQLIGLPYGTYQGGHLNFNGALWFLPCLFSTDIFFCIIHKYISRNNLLILLSCIILCFCLGTFFINNDFIYLPFGINTALFSIVFYAIGYIVNQSKYYSQITNQNDKKSLYLIISSLLLVQYLCLRNNNGSIETADIYYVSMAFIGIALCLFVSLLISKNKYIEYIGMNSLIIMAFQEQGYRAIIFVASHLCGIPMEEIRTNFVGALCISIITIICILPIIIFWNKLIKPMINKI